MEIRQLKCTSKYFVIFFKTVFGEIKKEKEGTEDVRTILAPSDYVTGLYPRPLHSARQIDKS
jgi:hypothetical protein